MAHDLNLPTIADGQADGQWQSSNDADAALADAVQDTYTVDFSGGNVSLTSAQFRSAMTFIPSGLSTNRDLTVPLVKRALFVVSNTDSADTITVKRGATSIAVAAGKVAVLYTDGTTDGLGGAVLASGTGGVASTRQIISGAGLTGGGDLSSDRTLAVGAGTGISVNADDVALNVNGLSEDTSPDESADFLLSYDSSASTHKKVKPDNIRLRESIIIAVGDETTAITTGTAKVTFRMPYAFTVTDVRASLNTVSSSGTPTIDINEASVSILSTKLTIDATELTSTTATTPAVISDAALADDAEMTIDIDTAGTGAKGLKVVLIGVRA